jgi:hypothetical protein
LPVIRNDAAMAVTERNVANQIQQSGTAIIL